MGILEKTLFPVVDLILPPRCASCGIITDKQGSFCQGCWQDLHFIIPPWCNSCGIPLPFETDADQQCGACLAKPPAHDGIYAAVAYCDISSEIALKLKYSGKIGLAKMIASKIERHLPDDKEDHILVPVPLHWTRLWVRSFNQSALIAQALSEMSNIPYAADMLIRHKKTALLRGKNSKQRKAEVAKAFAMHPQSKDNVRGKHILLIDDVYTSGATSDACVKILKQNGASSVKILCWARVLKDEQL